MIYCKIQSWIASAKQTCKKNSTIMFKIEFNWSSKVANLRSFKHYWHGDKDHETKATSLNITIPRENECLTKNSALRRL